MCVFLIREALTVQCLQALLIPLVAASGSWSKSVCSHRMKSSNFVDSCDRGFCGTSMSPVDLKASCQLF